MAARPSFLPRYFVAVRTFAPVVAGATGMLNRRIAFFNSAGGVS
jgi:membrane protein DedA with SNARE-associated domain